MPRFCTAWAAVVDDTGTQTGDVARSVQWTGADSDAATASFNLWKATEAAGECGLPKGFLAGAGHVFSVLGGAGDVMTLIDPGVENKTEGNVLRGDAGANLAGLGAMEFGGVAAGALGLAATVGWVPVAGQIVVIGTGLFLAGDWVYHGLGSAAKSVGSFLGL